MYPLTRFCFTISSHHFRVSYLIFCQSDGHEVVFHCFISLIENLFHRFMHCLSFFHKSPSHNLCPFSTWYLSYSYSFVNLFCLFNIILLWFHVLDIFSQSEACSFFHLFKIDIISHLQFMFV